MFNLNNDLKKVFKNITGKELKLLQGFSDKSDELYHYAKVRHWTHNEFCLALLFALDRVTEKKESRHIRELVIKIMSV